MEEHLKWYEGQRPLFESLSRSMESLLREVMTQRRLDHLAVTSRAKTIESFSGKLKRKEYKDPRREVTDLCGVRVITYIEPDVDRVSALVRELFVIDPKRSLDKSATLAVDKVGYRSVHYICTLPNNRTLLPEYAAFAGLSFEIQIRTVLQHAWAQIEHDRNYKLSGVLPKPLQRRLYLAAGLLEIADREFSSIALEVEQHRAVVQQKTSVGDYDLELTTESITSYLSTYLKEHATWEIEPVGKYEEMIRELEGFGIKTIADLDRLLSPDFVRLECEHYDVGEQTELGLVRDAMMLNDILRYFDQAWNHHWMTIDNDTFALLVKKLGNEVVSPLLKERGIDIDTSSGHRHYFADGFPDL